MTGNQGRIVIGVLIVIVTFLLIREARASDNWIGFWVTEVGMLVPFAISWWILGKSPKNIT
jgi:hypothetical protein